MNKAGRTATFQVLNLRRRETGYNGMIAPICSPGIAEAIWQSTTVLHVGRGYW